MDIGMQISYIVVITSAIGTIFGAWMKLRSLAKSFRAERELEAAKTLQEAKEADSRLKTLLDNKRELVYQGLNNNISKLEERLNALEESVAKDFEHVRETYNGEIRNLGDKIEDLRSDLRTQHGQLVSLLSEMIKKDR